MSSIKHHVTGLEYWRSLEQLAETPEIAEFIDKEFPGYDADTISHTSRRGFMKLMGAAMALAGVTLTGCRRWPEEKLAPYSSNPRGIMPGVPEQYATSWELGGVGIPLLVTSYDGRPIKIEGNPEHPASETGKDKNGKAHYGSADAFSQAALLEMYDPERSRDVIHRTVDPANGFVNRTHTTWEAFVEAAKPLFEGLKKKNGTGLAILSEATSSPSVAYLRGKLEEVFGKNIWYEYEPLSRDNEREGAKLAFGRKTDDGKFVPGMPLRPVLHLDKADVVICLDADPLGTHPNHTRYANDWAKNRRSADAQEGEDGKAGQKKMSRVFVAESGLSLTGAMADMRLGVSPSRIYALTYAIAARLAPARFAGVPTKPSIVPQDGEDLSPEELEFVKAAVKDLTSTDESGAKVNGIVAVGHHAPPDAHALAFAINGALGAVGTTVTYSEELDPWRPTHIDAITKLRDNINSGAVTTLLMLGGNPAYDAPADLNFAAALGKVPNSIHLSLYDNETSHLAKWHLPRAHFLECWGDSISWDDGMKWQGVVTLQQPLILPLFGGKSVIELLGIILGDGVTAGDKIIRRTQNEPAGETDEWEKFEKSFRASLEKGFIPSPFKVRPDPTLFPLEPAPPAKRKPSEDFTLRFEPDSRVYDGRFANNGWLQETPDPLTKLMWDNALLMNVKDALALDLEMGDLVEVTTPGGKITLPVCLLPGQPSKVVSISLGYGRTNAGPVGEGLGFNSYTIRTSKNPWIVPDVKIKKTGENYVLVTSSEHHLLSPMAQQAEEYRTGKKHQNGKIIREATLKEYVENPEDLGGKVRKVGLQLFAPTVENNFHDLHAWGMSIDLATCIGCNACAVACQAENNIPIVGKEQCLRHREMNWIRIDRYFRGDPEDPNPEIVFQPMTCQHCENAPCEQVCPVAATVHDSEGLNTMVYNRCVGTRYCSNNCPYKVRRFNYFDFHSQDPRANSKWLKNPYPNLPDMEQQDPAKYNVIKRMVFNPEVTIRMRGVMEKCTYCVQRIHLTVIAKRREGKDIVDGDIVTACQQACPTQAIIFGNLADKTSAVSLNHKSARAYDVLHDELNTKPRTRYLAKLRNPVV